MQPSERLGVGYSGRLVSELARVVSRAGVAQATNLVGSVSHTKDFWDDVIVILGVGLLKRRLAVSVLRASHRRQRATFALVVDALRIEVAQHDWLKVLSTIHAVPTIWWVVVGADVEVLSVPLGRRAAWCAAQLREEVFAHAALRARDERGVVELVIVTGDTAAGLLVAFETEGRNALAAAAACFKNN